MKDFLQRTRVLALVTLVGAAVVLAVLSPSPAMAAGKAGTTLAAYKTVDICELPNGDWQYSGEIAVWNEGSVETQGLAIQDCIQNKTGAGPFVDAYCAASFDPPLTAIPPGTSQLTAITTRYTIVGPALAGYIRNRAHLTIRNHSGALGTPKGPEPKATWLGTAVPLCPVERTCGCTYSQGYWGSKPGVVWPADFDRNAPFYLSGLTWQQVLDTPAGGNGYFILAHQYIAAVLNKASGSCVPTGIDDTLELAEEWFQGHSQGVPEIKDKGKTIQAAAGCYVNGSCGPQKNWGAIVEDYISGAYPEAPGHCGDE